MDQMTGNEERAVGLQRPDRTHRTLFLSDFHLGALGCRPERILSFLEQNDAETIYLVGDILDTWHPLVPIWTDVHDRIIRLLLRRARGGTRVVYLPGNHDHALRAHYGTHLGCFEVTEQALHRTADGRSFLVLHGDCADRRLFRAHMWTRIGSRMDGALRGLDARLKRWGRTLHPDDRSLIEVLLSWVKVLMNFGDGFEIRLTDMARALGQDGVICGHSHQAALHDDHGIVFANCGDWVDSFTAIAEDAEGRLSLLQAAEPQRQLVAGRPYPGIDAPGLAG
jgi:UDP-2,3-diacylglucosamine pyrophosphatase LpxH